MIKYVFAGDSWALKGFTDTNYNQSLNDDQRLADFWPWQYHHCITPGQGNLTCLDQLISMNIAVDIPIIWIYTEPGRDYGRIYNKPPHEWIESENIFELRATLNYAIMKEIKNKLANPVAFIGGLSDIETEIAQSLGFKVLHPSWQTWIAKTLNSQWFKFGWGASDVGWRVHSNDITPSIAATLAWDEQIKEWCWWADQGYFCHEHPSLRANQEFAKYLQPKVQAWLEQYEK